jgi:hypothetical protein
MISPLTPPKGLGSLNPRIKSVALCSRRLELRLQFSFLGLEREVSIRVRRSAIRLTRDCIASFPPFPLSVSTSLDSLCSTALSPNPIPGPARLPNGEYALALSTSSDSTSVVVSPPLSVTPSLSVVAPPTVIVSAPPEISPNSVNDSLPVSVSPERSVAVSLSAELSVTVSPSEFEDDADTPRGQAADQ